LADCAGFASMAVFPVLQREFVGAIVVTGNTRTNSLQM